MYRFFMMFSVDACSLLVWLYYDFIHVFVFTAHIHLLYRCLPHYRFSYRYVRNIIFTCLCFCAHLDFYNLCFMYFKDNVFIHSKGYLCVTVVLSITDVRLLSYPFVLSHAYVIFYTKLQNIELVGSI